MLDLQKTISSIPGWLTKREALFLYNQAKKVRKRNVIVEIGSWKGKSTTCLGWGVRDGQKASIYAIDPHTGTLEHKKQTGSLTADTYTMFLQNIKDAGIDTYVIPMRKTSEQAVLDFTKPIEFLFIDGDHSFKGVTIDYTLWSPKVIVGGTVAFHDSWHPFGVQIASAIALLTSREVRNPRFIDTLTIVEKVEKNTFSDRVKNSIFVLYRFLFGWIKGLNIVIQIRGKQ